jgi:hypothetical protein
MGPFSYMNLAHRRFLRKPNYGEAAVDLAELKTQMKREGFPQYAAFCALAVARCEQALGHAPQEAAQYRDAGPSPPRAQRCGRRACSLSGHHTRSQPGCLERPSARCRRLCLRLTGAQ